jgi:hypothetical protein
VTPTELLHRLAGRLWKLAASAAADLASGAASFPLDSSAPPPLQGRLLIAFDRLPGTNPLAGFLRDVLGELPEGGPIRLHGWERAPGATRGVALVATEGAARAVLAITPGDPPTVDLVVTAGAGISIAAGDGAWQATAAVSSDVVWDVELSPDMPASPPLGTVTIDLQRVEPLTIGPVEGPGLSATKIGAGLRVSPGSPLSVALSLEDFRAALLPEPLAALLGAGSNRSTTPSPLQIQADAASGLRFEGSGLRVELPVQLALPALSARGFAVELAERETGIELTATIGLRAQLPGIPVRAQLDGVGVTVPFSVSEEALGPALGAIDAPLPSGIGIELELAPVSGGGDVRMTPSGSYAGVLDVDLGVFGVQALGVLQLPKDGMPTSLVALLAATFPYPGIQLGFGFAIDAVGGLVGINRRADTEQLRALVSDGHADRVLFPENAVERAEEITRSLDASFPAARGRCVIAPMVRINWSGRMVTLSGAVVLDLPNPAQVVLLGRLLVAVPDPAAPLIRLQASVLGRIDPSIPETELLVSLAGSWIVTTPVSGEIYLLARGGEGAVFVLSAGGFHPRYTRPAGVPALQRLTLDLGGGFLGLRAEAYLAVTSNAMMFGAKLQLDATIAGCGVEGNLGLDALFVWEPAFSFSVHVYASVAVLAFGHRLASVGLDFTLEGPAPWHAFGTGSISVLFWDVSLDFDVRWGDAPVALSQERDILRLLERALAEPTAWAAGRPLEQRNGIRLTDEAKADLTRGRAVQADATLRISQTVVPLGEPIQRFARSGIPEQRWDMEGDGAPVTARFVPGEFFNLSEEQQLTMPAFAEAQSGVSISGKDVLTGRAHLVDDSYETGYKVEPGFQPADPGITFNLAIAQFALERFARVGAPEERLARWRFAQASLPARQVAMR